MYEALLFSQRNFKRPLSSVNLIWIGILKGSEGNVNNLLLLVWLLVMLNFFFFRCLQPTGPMVTQIYALMVFQ